MIEQDVIHTNEEGAIIQLPQEWIDNFLRVYKKCREKHNMAAEIPKEPFLVKILED